MSATDNRRGSIDPEEKLVRIGAPVDATDGRCGKLTRLIVDPESRALTDLVVTPLHHGKRSRLVPVNAVEKVENEVIHLRCARHQLDQFDAADDTEFLMPADVDPGGYKSGSESWPLYVLELAHGPGSNRHQPLYSDRVPVGEVEICRGDAVHAKDGWIGEVGGLVIDPSDHQATHVLVQQGHLRGRKKVAIPIGSAAHIGDEIRVDLTKEQVAELPAVKLTSNGPHPPPCLAGVAG